MHELDPNIRQKSEWILKSSSELNGPEYLRSGIKRALDLLVSAPSSPFVLGTCAIGGAAVYLGDSSWPFVDVGLRADGIVDKDKPFWKIRSMIPGARDMEIEVVGERALAELKREKTDPRITRVGRIIRKTNLDETPQLLSTLRGDLSLVGSRMIGISEWTRNVKPNSDMEPYKGFIDLLKNGMKFGVTGMYVVLRREGVMNFRDRIFLEVLYGQRATLAADLKIIALTFPQVFKSTG